MHTLEDVFNLVNSKGEVTYYCQVCTDNTGQDTTWPCQHAH